MADHDDDLAVSKTEGFKVGEKKTLQEYQELGEFPPHPPSVLDYITPTHILTLPRPRRQGR